MNVLRHPDYPVSTCAAGGARTASVTACGAAPTPDAPARSPAHRWAVFGYGVFAYAVFFGTFLYGIGWIGGVVTPTALDAPRGPGAMPLGLSLLVNVALLAAFALQHSVMARPWFKARWTRFVPEPLERSTYVLLSSVMLIITFVLWQPLGGRVWHVTTEPWRTMLYVLMGAGWTLVLYSTFLINHFDLFGLRQVWLHLRSRRYTHLPFKTPSLYRLVRHPLYVGWFTTFWATPHMSAAHLLFAVVCTAYMLAATRWEERDLVELHGRAYADYRRRVPKFFPTLGRA